MDLSFENINPLHPHSNYSNAHFFSFSILDCAQQENCSWNLTQMEGHKAEQLLSTMRRREKSGEEIEKRKGVQR